MYTYDIFEPVNNIDKAIADFNDQLGPIYGESWMRDKEPVYKKPFDMNIAALLQMWLQKTLKLFTARYDGRIVGFVVGMVFRPLPYQASVFQFEDWYVQPDHRGVAEQPLFDYVVDAIRFIGCDEIWVADKADRVPLVRGKAWKEENQFLLRRYVKE